MIIQKKFINIQESAQKNNDKLLNACKSNAKYTFEFKNNLIQYLYKIKIENCFEIIKGGDPYIFFVRCEWNKSGKPGLNINK